MNKVIQMVSSRTFWTIAVIVAMNTVPQLKDLVSQGILDTVTSILGALAVYFHITPSQDYNA